MVIICGWKIAKNERKSMKQSNQIKLEKKNTACCFGTTSFSSVDNLCLEYKHWVENHCVKANYSLWVCNNSKCPNEKSLLCESHL